MSPKFFLACLALSLPTLMAQPGPSLADDWRSRYHTESEFESCCGHKDCQTAAELGYPDIIRRSDGSYDVRVKGYWIKYHHPAVHPSEDDKVWICYLDNYQDPDPLCLFLPDGTV